MTLDSLMTLIRGSRRFCIYKIMDTKLFNNVHVLSSVTTSLDGQTTLNGNSLIFLKKMSGNLNGTLTNYDQKTITGTFGG